MVPQQVPEITPLAWQIAIARARSGTVESIAAALPQAVIDARELEAREAFGTADGPWLRKNERGHWTLGHGTASKPRM